MYVHLCVCMSMEIDGYGDRKFMIKQVGLIGESMGLRSILCTVSTFATYLSLKLFPNEKYKMLGMLAKFMGQCLAVGGTQQTL